MTNIFYDTEFLDDGKIIDLISIGLIDDRGDTYYAVNADCNINRIMADRWLWDNVVPHLPMTTLKGLPEDCTPNPNIMLLDRSSACVKPRWVIANEVRDFILQFEDPQLWAYYAAYDHVALAQLWGPMVNLPTGIPKWTNDLMQEATRVGLSTFPAQLDEHDALADARWNKLLHKVIVQQDKFAKLELLTPQDDDQ